MKETDKNILQKLGIAALNPMQEDAVAKITAHKEVLLLAPTGSGKTLAFLLPLLHQLKKNYPKVQCLILSPSRELALQTGKVWKNMGTAFKSVVCYGKHDMQTEIDELREAPALLIGTPGRIADHIRRNSFDASSISVIILDEFDKSLSLGFEEEMSFIFSSVPSLERKILVSATASVAIPGFVAVTDELVVADHLSSHLDQPKFSLQAVYSEQKDKLQKLFDLLCYFSEGSVLVFCNHREAVERAAAFIKESGIQCAAFHGGMEQMQREQALVRFQNGSVRYLIATDLAARGLDIPGIAHIVHYHLPATEAEFIHRNGRTARMRAEGEAWLLLYREETLPAWLPEKLPEVKLPKQLPLPLPAAWATIFINGGKKDKLNKVDLVGFFLQKGGLQKEELGLIVVKDHVSFIAVSRKKQKSLLALVQDQKIKGQKYRIALAR